MNVELNELQESARKVVGGAGLAANESVTWSQLVELGWLLVAVPDALSGLGMGLPGACVLHSELGRGLSAAPYLPATLAVDAVCHSGVDDRDNWLERMIAGELVTCSLAESSVQMSGRHICGNVEGVQSADSARHMLVWTAGNEIVALIALKQSGIDIAAKNTWDQTRRLFNVCLNDIDLGEQTVLAEGAEAESLIRRLLVQRDFALAADAVGGASSILAMTVEHLQTRVQFKRPLAMFQSLKHRCADMKASIDAAEALLFDAAHKVGNEFDSPDERVKAMGAKFFAATMFARVAEDCLQLHGGIGMAVEHPCHLFLKRALLNEHLGSSASVCARETTRALMAGAM
jgi:alkylation response protein AidB-like acyl-CoA dehydrogenase